MRAWLSQYSVERPPNLADALSRLSSQPDHWTLFAGGTDLMVLLETGRMPPRHFLDISGLDELRGIEVTDQQVAIGALATYTDLLENSVIRSELPLIAEAARQTGAVAIQNRGTVGGNIANASPAADLPPALLVYDAGLDLTSSRGTRRIAYDTFHRGYKQMDLAGDELILRVVVTRRPQTWKQTYRKVGTRRAQAISKVCFAAAALMDGGRVTDVRIALGSVAPTVIRARATEDALRSRLLSPDTVHSARAVLEREIAPIDDMRSSARYRQRVAGNLLEEFLG